MYYIISAITIIVINIISITTEGRHMVCTSVVHEPQHGCWRLGDNFTWSTLSSSLYMGSRDCSQALRHTWSIYTCWPISLGLSLIWKSYSYICIGILFFKLNLLAYLSVHTWHRTHLTVRAESAKVSSLNTRDSQILSSGCRTFQWVPWPVNHPAGLLTCIIKWTIQRMERELRG